MWGEVWLAVGTRDTMAGVVLELDRKGAPLEPKECWDRDCASRHRKRMRTDGWPSMNLGREGTMRW